MLSLRDAAETGDARIVAKFVIAVPFGLSFGIGGKMGLQNGVGIDPHRAEFPRFEPVAMPADAPVAVIQRAGTRSFDQNRHNRQRGGNDDQCQQRQGQVDAPFDDLQVASINPLRTSMPLKRPQRRDVLQSVGSVE